MVEMRHLNGSYGLRFVCFDVTYVFYNNSRSRTTGLLRRPSGFLRSPEAIRFRLDDTAAVPHCTGRCLESLVICDDLQKSKCTKY